jgi:Ca2+/H+ antiporter
VQAEYVNAVQFALHNNVALSIEIGSSGAIQIAMIQMPLLVVVSVLIGNQYVSVVGCDRVEVEVECRWCDGARSGATAFTLIFSLLEVGSVIFAVIIVNYLSIEGRSNYFLGSALVRRRRVSSPLSPAVSAVVERPATAGRRCSLGRCSWRPFTLRRWLQCMKASG